MKKEHVYQLSVQWTGNTGEGTKTYSSYKRSHTVSIPQKTDVLLSSDPAFRGDATKHNPEELLVMALSSCHMLWFLHLCAESDIVVTNYEDHPVGTMLESNDGGGQFTSVVLHPKVTINDASQIVKTNSLHHEANKKCFIARSCNFPVRHEATCFAVKK